MKIQLHAHMLAGGAETNPDGTLLLRQAGIGEVNAAGWPARAEFVLVTRLELDIEAASQLHHMSVRIWHDKAGEITTWRQPLAAKVADANRPIYLNLLSTVQCIVPMEGMLGITAHIDELQLPILRLVARTVPGSGSMSPHLRPPDRPFRSHGRGKRKKRRT